MLDSTGTFYFAYDDFIPDNQELRLKEREQALAKQPYMTVNEVRAMAGLPPVKGGDTIYSAPGTPLGQPVVAPTPANDDGEEEDEEKPKKALPPRARSFLKRERFADDLLGSVRNVLESREDPDEVAHKAFVGRVEEHEKLVADKVREFNNR